MINISWDSFDKAFWLSSTNIANLIRSAISIDINIGQVENDVDNLGNQVNNLENQVSDINNSISDIGDYVYNDDYGIPELWNEIGIIYGDLADILSLMEGLSGSIIDISNRVSALEEKVG